MRNRCARFSQASALAALLLLSCSLEPVVRTSELTPQPVTPTGTSRLAGSAIIVESQNVEPLTPGFRLLVWAVTESGTVLLGPLVPGNPAQVKPATAGITLAEIDELLVTEEASTTELPTTPSPVVVLRGAVGGELVFGGTLRADDFAQARGSLRIEDDRAEVSLRDLPALPAGYQYSVWLQIDTAGKSHAHLSTSSGDHGGVGASPSGELTLLGPLPDPRVSTRFDIGRTLYEARECWITIESLRGVDAASTCTAMHGEVELPELGEAAEGHLH